MSSKTTLPLFFWVFVLSWLGLVRVATAQSPVLDPAFVPAELYAPAYGRQLVQQADGKRLLLGDFVVANGEPAPGLARLLPASHRVDRIFQANIAGLQGTVDLVLPLPGGQLLLLSNPNPAAPGGGSLTLGGLTRQRLLRLHADGSPDAGFQATFLAGQEIMDFAAQPNGQVLIIGNFTAVNGQPAGRLARLNPDGSLDTAFQAALGAGLDNAGARLSLQADGGILVSGPFSTVSGVAQRGLARLLPSGQFDPAFRPVLPAPVYAECLITQPDGAVLVAETMGANWPALRRFLPTGAVDNTFHTGTGFRGGFHRNGLRGRYGNAGLGVQPDGKIVVSTHSLTYNGALVGRLLRLWPHGSLDTSFSNPLPAPTLLYEDDYMPAWLQMLPSGQLLLAGSPAAVLGAPECFSLLQPHGTRDISFWPVVYSFGSVHDVVRQPDGKYVVGGRFSSCNGQPASNLARLHANGTLDAAFTDACRADYEVYKLALQPDGKLLVGGRFGRIGSVSQVAIARLLPGGAPDVLFAPPSRQLVYNRAVVSKLALQPDGKVLIGGDFNLTNNLSNPNVSSQLRRLDGSRGTEDVSFQPPANAGEGLADMLVQPDGKILGVGRTIVPLPQPSGSGALRGAVVAWRLLPTGAMDPNFFLYELLISSPSLGPDASTALALDNSGNIYVGGRFTRVHNYTGTYSLLRLFPNGRIDLSFSAPILLTRTAGAQVSTVAVQPDGRVLVGGQLDVPGFMGQQGLVRLEATSLLDASFSPARGPGLQLRKVLAQADGAIVVAGSFTQVGGLPTNGFARLLDANALPLRAGQTRAQLQAWPVPAHEVLRVVVAGGAPSRAELLDALGRPVRTQAVSQADFTMPLLGLAAGVYCLRVHCAGSSPIVRRVVVE